MEPALRDWFEAKVPELEALYQCMMLVRGKPGMSFEFAVAPPGFSWTAALAVLRDTDATPATLRATLGTV